MFIPAIPMVEPSIPPFIWNKGLGHGQYWYRSGNGTWHDGRYDQWAYKHDWEYRTTPRNNM